MTGFCGIVLAAGAGSRFGGPKALAHGADGVPWLVRVVSVLRAGGCDRVVVVLGARAEEALPLVPDGTEAVVAADWAEGMAASLRAGLAAADGADAVVVATVDIPDLPAAAVERLRAASPRPSDALAQAVYAGRPGHPVVIGASHREALAASLTGDRGARPFLVAHGVHEVECGDLWSGEDVDRR
ncbi:nucleotidyltransferase family protein [Microbacterium gilvum]|uniref:Nucleotidyltransferase family protein n=1 Tax=Microbacterium gilvum TaxID=1336204 RepID=A0ABP9A0I1_9MICO